MQMPTHGLKLIESYFIVEQYRFPRSKKRRIRNKWAKQKRNFRPSLKVIKMGDRFLCHPVCAQKLRQQIAESARKHVSFGSSASDAADAMALSVYAARQMFPLMKVNPNQPPSKS